MNDEWKWFKPTGICFELNLYPRQIECLLLSIKTSYDKLEMIVRNTIFLGSLPPEFHTSFKDMCDVGT
jgi:hypothetical protein